MNIRHAFSSFSANDLEAVKEFYGKTIGLKVTERENLGLSLHLPHGAQIFIYPKDKHEPATFTVLNISVRSIDEAVDELAAKGVEFERYDDGMVKTDEKGIARGGEGMPSMAWFKDPAGNLLAVMEE